ncbi:unnamed protein product [marine sediment metagenome]|uniref:Uncharacterized protein n=1 Tax=marine sediment metagenome TaxID=412755 RepID=X0V2Z3_9ZZZZ
MANSYYAANLNLTNLLKDELRTYELALFITNPGRDGTGGTEVSAGGYGRQTIEFGTPSVGSSFNSNEVVFSDATGDWGTVTGFGVYDDQANLLRIGTLTTPRAIYIGDIVRFSIGAIECKE